MAALKDIKRKINSGIETKQITRDHEQVAAAKFKTAQTPDGELPPLCG